MSETIDERVVEMRFDNRQFEKGVKTSLGTLDKLKSSLDLSGAAKGLSSLNEEVKKVRFAPLAEGLETVRTKFSALEVMAITALSNITNSAVNAGKRLVASMSVDQITAGWSKLEQKTTSVGTLIAQGYDMDTVEDQLSRLNWFTDETSYEFTAMVDSISKFTASGQDLKASTTALMGIANWAALSGQNASTASHAMGQLSQAMGAGVMRKEDYKSIQNVSMDTDEFRQKALDAGVALGTLKKNLDGTYESLVNSDGAFSKSQFAEHLTKDAWFTSDVMMKVFTDYSAAVDQIYDYANEKGITTSQAIEELGDEVDQFGLKAFRAAQEAKTWTDVVDSIKDAVSTGWMNTFENIFGDYEEQRVLWTDLANAMYDVFAASGDIRNEILSEWKELGGRDALVESFWNAWESVASIINPIKEAFREIFPRTTAEQLMKITENIRDFTAKLTLNDEQAEKVKITFKGLFAVLDIGFTAIKTLAGVLLDLAGNFSGIPIAVLNASTAIGRWTIGLRNSIKETNVFEKTANKLVGVFQKIIDNVKTAVSAVKTKIDATGFEDFLDVLKAIYGFALKVGKVVVGLGASIGTALLSAFKNGGIRGVIDVINGGLFGSILVGIRRFTDGLSDAFGGVTDILDGVTGILDGVKGSLEAWQKNLNAGTLSKIAKAIAILAISLAVIASIDSERLTGALTGITVLFVELMGALSLFNKLNLNFAGVSKSITVMMGLSTSILILASALKKLSSLEWNELAVGLTGVLGLTAIIVAAATALSKIKNKVMKGTTSIVIFSSAIKILASACKDLSALSWDELAKGLAGVGVLLAELDIFLNTAKFSGKVFGTAMGTVALASAITILASAAKTFAAMKWTEIARGLAAIGGLLTEIALFTKLTANAKNVRSTGFALIETATAMKIFAAAVSDFSGMSWDELGRGLTGMAGALAAVVAAMKLMPKNTAGVGAGLVVVGAALNVIAAALDKFGKNSWGDTAKGIVALGGAIGVLAAGLKLMKGTLSGAASMTIAATALALLTPELKILGGMSLKQIGVGLTALAGAFTVLGIAAKLLKPLVGTMIKVSLAITLFGAGCALAGAGILAVSVALTTLVASLVLTASSLGEIITAFCESIANSSKSISAAFISLIKASCASLTETVPVVADALMTVLVESLTTLKTHLPQIVDLLMDIAVDLLDRLSLRVPELVSSFVDMLGTFMKTLDDALGKGGWEKLLLSVTVVSAVFLALAASAKLISSIPVSGAAKGIAGFGIVVAGMAGVLAVLGGLAQIPGLSRLIGDGVKIFGQLGMAIGAFIGNLVNGLVSNMPKNLSEVLTACASIEAIALAVSPMSELLGNVDISGAAKGIAGVIILIGGIAAILAALGGLKQIPGFDYIVGEGAKVLLLIGEAIGSFVGGIVQSMTCAITSSLEEVIGAIASVGSMVGAVAVLAKIVGKLKVNPAAVAEGFAGVAIVIGCIEVILAALGGLAQIPGFDWIIGDGGRALCQIGSILGEFLGSLISSIGVGLTNGLPAMGQNLSDFMTSVRPFIEGAKDIDESVMKGILSLSEAILCITAVDLISGITSFLTGGSSIAKFGEEIAAFGPHLKNFSDSVAGINNENVVAAANAAKTLSEMADTIPNEGGVAAWFAGENSVSKFGSEIAGFGTDLKTFSDNVAGITPENIVAAANAGKALAEMAATVPNEGGVAAWFAGENSVSKFGEDISRFGKDLKTFSDNVAGISPENILAASSAGKALADMAATIPNEGGVAAWFAGENSVSKFGEDISGFGKDLKTFSDNVAGICPENVTAAANAGRALAEMADIIPNEGGVAAWFAGENSLSTFGEEVASFGTDLKTFSDNVAGICPENVVAAANAGKSLAEMASIIPNEGGVAAWFAGENSVSKFGEEIASFGTHIKSFSDNVMGLDVPAVKAASEAGKTLVEMADKVPNENGVVGWFTGNNSLAKFGGEIADFGGYLKQFSENVAGIDVPAVKAASEAGKTLADLTSAVPNSNGVKAWFTGEQSLSRFGGDIASFGKNLKDFDANVKGITPQNVKSAAEAGKNLAEMCETVPDSGGVKAWFTGDNNIAKFGEKIADFGKHLKNFSDNVNDIVPDKIKAAAESGKLLAEMAGENIDTSSFEKLDDAISVFGHTIKDFTKNVSGADVSGATAQVRRVAELSKELGEDDLSGFNKFTDGLKKVSTDGMKNFVGSIKNAENDVKKTLTDIAASSAAAVKDMSPDFACAGKNIAENLSSGMTSGGDNAKSELLKLIDNIRTGAESKKSDFLSLGKTLAANLTDGIKTGLSSLAGEIGTKLSNALSAVRKNYRDPFGNCGTYLVAGFAEGMKDPSGNVPKAAREMARSALEAIRAELDIHSPSKETSSLAENAGEGFTRRLSEYADKSYDAGAEVATAAGTGLADAIYRIADIVDGEIECTPTIRPVLDLSDVTDGASRISGLFAANRSMDIAARTSAGIEDYTYGRQRAAGNADVVEAVSALREDVAALRGVVGKLKVVMDTGALVGALTPTIDSSLGKNAKFAARGI